MPQPLSQLNPNAIIIIGNAGTRVFAHNPQLGILAMEAIASWSNVEMFLLNYYIELLGGAKKTAVTMYLALETQSAKTSAIQAIARHKLSPENQSLLAAILSLAKTQQKNRDKLAHWIWGYSPQFLDAYLLCNPKKLVDLPVDRSEVYVYKQQDFTELIQANDRLCGYGLKFQFILRGHIANEEGQLYAELCAEPEIQEKLNRQA